MIAFFDKLDAWFEANDVVFFAFILAFAAIVFAGDVVSRAVQRTHKRRARKP